MKYKSQKLPTTLSVAAAAALIVASAAGAIEPEHPPIKDQPELNRVVARLNAKQTRMQALSELINFASGELYQYGSMMMFYPDDQARRLYKAAAAAVRRCEDKDTVRAALESPDQKLQFWALRSITGKEVALIPALKALATADHSDWRDLALEKLRLYPSCVTFVKEQIATSTDVDVLMREVHDDADFNRRILALLRDPKPEVRIRTVEFISANPSMAPMFKREFDKLIFSEAVALTKSQSAAERAPAIVALVVLRKYGEEQVLTRLVEMSADPSAEVRWRVANRLKEFPGSTSSKTLSVLLTDKSPPVRFFAIQALGAADHIAELQALSQCEDEETRGMAADLLKGFANTNQATQPAVGK